MNPSSELYKVARVAALLDVSRKRIYNLIDEGRLECLRLSRRGIRIPRRSIDEFIRQCTRDEKRRRDARREAM